MNLWKEYLQPQSIGEVLDLLHESPKPVAIIAGGTDLLLDLRQGRHHPVHTLIDITYIPEMKGVDEKADGIHLGAATTFNEIIHHPLLIENAACLVEACSQIGGPQVRSVGTIGGNVAHALPAGDGSIALLALEAEVKIVSTNGVRWQPLEDFFVGVGKPGFDRLREVLTGFRIPIGSPRTGSAFQRIMRPQGVAIAILNMALNLQLTSAGEIDGASLTVGPAGPIPFRARKTEAALAGRTPDEATIQEVKTILNEETHFRTSAHRATAEYREHLVGILFQRVLNSAHQRVVDREKHDI
jgi:carbon-monoxide dehydrogenase medium subunit